MLSSDLKSVLFQPMPQFSLAVPWLQDESLETGRLVHVGADDLSHEQTSHTRDDHHIHFSRL